MPTALGTVASHRTAPTGGGAWTPTQLPSLLAWLDATVDGCFTYSTGNDPGNPPNTYVSQWRDLSGNNYHGNSNSNAGYHPKRNVTINGLKAVDYSTGYVGARKGLVLTGLASQLTKPATYVAIVRLPPTIIGGGALVGSSQVPAGLTLYAETNGAMGLILPGVSGIGISASGVVAPSTAYVLTCTYSSGGAYSIRVNGNQVASGTNDFSFPSGGVVGVGSGTDNETGSAGAFIGEAIICGEVLPVADVVQTESYLGTKWGVFVSPIPTTGLQLWLDADDASTFTYSSGVLVSEWRDRSGNNRHATAGFEPSRNGSQNGRTTVVFNSHSVGNTTPAITVTDNYAIFTVSKKTSGGAEAFPFFNGRAANNGYGPAMTINDGVHMGTLFGGVAWHGTNSNTPSGHVVIGLQRTSGVTTVYLNGVAETPTAANTPAMPTTGFVLGNKMPHGDVGGVAFLGDIAEVLVYNRALDAVERQQVEQYLKTKWGTP